MYLLQLFRIKIAKKKVKYINWLIKLNFKSKLFQIILTVHKSQSSSINYVAVIFKILSVYILYKMSLFYRKKTAISLLINLLKIINKYNNLK